MRNARILIVEDDWIVAEDLRSSVVNLGYSVTGIAFSGEVAVHKALEDMPDLILMDIMLKGKMLGTEAALEIKKQADIPVIYVTAYIRNNLPNKYDFVKNCGYITKPFEEQNLKETIEMALSRDKRAQ